MNTIFSAAQIQRVNAGTGVIFGVSVITEGPAIGHNLQIDSVMLGQVKWCAESFRGGVRVKMDHGTGFGSIVGVLKNFSRSGPKLIADLHLLKTHTEFKKILEIATNIPESVGLSIAFSGLAEEKGGVRYARCQELYSVDLVDNPAANPSGLFSVFSAKEEKPGERPNEDALKACLAEVYGFDYSRSLILNHGSAEKFFSNLGFVPGPSSENPATVFGKIQQRITAHFAKNRK